MLLKMLDHIPSKQNRFLLLYGSATGQAQAIAEDIAEKAGNFGLFGDLHSLEETDKKFSLEKEKCVVIITSTTGDGEPPPNAEKFMRRIRKRTLGRDYLAHLQYSMLGLGDSNYSNFCRCPRDMDNRLEELGAQRFYPTGLADDGVGLEIVVDPWLEGLYPAIQKYLGVTESKNGTLTETVQSLILSGSNKLPKWKQEKSSDKKVVNGESSLAKSSSSELIDNNEWVNENSDAASNVKAVSRSDSGFADSSETANSRGYVNNKSVPILNGIVNVEAQASSNVSSEPIPDALSQEIQQLSTSDLLSHTLASSSEETPISSSDAQIKAISPPQNSANHLDTSGKQKWPETPCIPTEVSGLPSSSVPLARSSPPLSEQTLTIPVLPPPFLSANFSGGQVQTSALSYQNGCKLPCAASDVFKVQILSAHVLTASDAVKKTLLLRLNIEGLDMTYSPGDAISIICPNNSSEVDLLLLRLGQTERADDTLTLSVKPDTTKRRAAIPPHIHPVTTLRHVLTTCLNIREPPSKAFIRALIEHTNDECDKRRMQELCSKEGAQEYTQLVREPAVSLLDFLYAFSSCTPPLETVLEHLPRLQPRPYSICSCPSASPACLDFVFNLVETPSDTDKGHLYTRRGVCTGWLEDITSSLQLGNNEDAIEISIYRRTNQHFQPPDDISKPLIMIGPGTGVAPFVGFLHERAHRKCQLEGSAGYGATWLFYGCRNKNKDYLFREELQTFETEGTLTKLCVACSRDPPADTSDTALLPRRYVQDLLWVMAPEISSLLTESEALVYICGDAKNMTKDVNSALEGILHKVAGLSPDDAHMFMMKKRIHKTYFEDVWT